jgi:hypothetical protein
MKIWIILIALIFNLGCLDGKEEVITVEELTANVFDNMNSVETYEFEMDSATNISAEGMSMVMDMKLIGAIDKTNRKMKMVMETSMLGMTMETQQYVIGDTMYMSYLGQWIKGDFGDMSMTTTGDPWSESDQLEAQREMWEKYDVTIEGKEKVDGREVYKVVFDPGDDVNTFMESAMPPESPLLGEMTSELFDFRELALIAYVDAKDFYILKHVVIIDTGIKGADSTGEMAMEMTTTFKNYDKPVSIEVPPEALDAEEIPTMNTMTTLRGE